MLDRRTPLPLMATLLIVSSAGCASHAPPHAPPLPVRDVRTEAARIVERLVGEEVIGTVRARDTVEISSTVMGRVAELHCALGARVKAGELIARLSVQELTARLDQARENLAQAALELARTTRLRASGATTGAEYDAATSRHRLAEAAQAEAATMAGYAAVRAPFSGIVTAKRANQGDMAMPGRPLCVVEDPAALRFEATVPESLARAFAQAPTIQVLLDAPGPALTTTVAEVSPNADATSRTVLVKLALPQDPRLRAGAFGRATVPANRVRALTVPARAVIRNGQLEAVYVVGDGAARMRLVRTGRTVDGTAPPSGGAAGRGGPTVDGTAPPSGGAAGRGAPTVDGTAPTVDDRIELVSGLREGEQVVIDVADRLVDGQPVRVAQ